MFLMFWFTLLNSGTGRSVLVSGEIIKMSFLPAFSKSWCRRKSTGKLIPRTQQCLQDNKCSLDICRCKKARWEQTVSSYSILSAVVTVRGKGEEADETGVRHEISHAVLGFELPLGTVSFCLE